jgi:hypothetical protein
VDLTSDIAFWQLSDLADDVHCLISCYGSQAAFHGPEPQTGGRSSLHESVVMLQHICLNTVGTGSDDSVRHSPSIPGLFVDRQDARPH